MSKATRRYYRTLLLGVAAMGALVWSAMDQFDIPPEEILSFFYKAVITVAVIIVSAALVATLWITARKILKRWNR